LEKKQMSDDFNAKDMLSDVVYIEEIRTMDFFFIFTI